MVADFEARYGDMSVERIDADEVTFDYMVAAVQSVPFLCERKLVVLRGSSLNKEFTEKFEDFLAAASESTDILITESKIDKRTAFYKQLQKKTDFHVYKELDAVGVARWASQYTAEQGGTLSMTDANYLVQRVSDAARMQKRVGANQLLVKNEVDKLLLYSPKISRQTIDLMTEENPTSKIFDLLEAAFSGDAARMQRLYTDQRTQGVEPQQIIAMLVWQLYIFAVVKAGRGKSASVIAQDAGLRPYSIESAQRAMNRVEMARLREMVRELRELDVRSKTEGIVLDEALQLYLLSIC